jgi:hypothetical protein
MARKQPTADAFLADLDAKGIVYSVTGARKEAVDYHEPQRKGRPAKLVPDARWTVPDDMLNGIESSLTVVMRCRTKCMNARDSHWSERSKRVRDEHAELSILLAPHDMKRERLSQGCCVRMTRIGQKVDGDNLQGYLKSVRDFIASWLLAGRMGQRDSSPLIEWEYDQRRIGTTYGVVVSIQPKEQA